MLHVEEEKVRELLLLGEFGLERETLRVTGDGFPAHTPDIFAGEKNIVKDFSENQVEINTGVFTDPQEAVSELRRYSDYIQKKLLELEEKEYIWPFSNPPYLRGDEDIPIARYYGKEAEKTQYRRYLEKMYGRKKMSFCGIHVNFSFQEELVVASFEAEAREGYCKLKNSLESCGQSMRCQLEKRDEVYREYKNRLYLDLAEQLMHYGWIIDILTAASPLLDGSFENVERLGEDLFTGHASERCGENGYWNSFVPILDFESPETYSHSIDKYVQGGLLKAMSELYFPIRLKNGGVYNAESLSRGFTHIELRMFDLNPFAEGLLEARDVKFVQLFCIYLLSRPVRRLAHEKKEQAVQHFWDASHYSLRKKIICDDGQIRSIGEQALIVLKKVRDFFENLGMAEAREIIDFEIDKLENPKNRYAVRVREMFSGGFVKKGMDFAKFLAENIGG